MKGLKISILGFLSAGLFACETEIMPELEKAEPVIVVDAWINGNVGEEKVVLVSSSVPYYNAVLPPALQNCDVRVIKQDDQTEHIFAEVEPGKYVDNQVNDTAFWAVGNSYQLTITRTGGVNIQSDITTMNRVPPIDTVFFKGVLETSFEPEGYYAEFFARDPVGPGDTYWIKTYRNDIFLNRPSEINIAYDAGFSAGGNVDGINFITPIREGINADEVDQDGDAVAPFILGDSIRVELHSISNDAHQFMVELQTQIDRPGGFGELFAVPLANLPTNLVNLADGGRNAVGFFNVASVSIGEAYLDPTNPPPFE